MNKNNMFWLILNKIVVFQFEKYISNLVYQQNE